MKAEQSERVQCDEIYNNNKKEKKKDRNSLSWLDLISTMLLLYLLLLAYRSHTSSLSKHVVCYPTPAPRANHLEHQNPFYRNTNNVSAQIIITTPASLSLNCSFY